MGKDGFLSPKAISNRIKAKGLNKLRWYCQMCEKTCRDANGFKCHLTSEAHQRQMMLFANTPGKFLHQYSNEFHSAYLEVLKRRGSTRVLANRLYQEVIAERHHTHIHSTRWGSLTAYLMFLKASKLADVEETPKGFFVTYIDSNPDTVKREAELEKIEKAEARDAARFQKEIDKRVATLSEQAGDVKEPEFSEFQRVDGQTIGFAIATKKDEPAVATNKTAADKRKLDAIFGVDDDDDDDDDANANNNDNDPKHSSSANADNSSQPAKKAKTGDDQRKHSSVVSEMAAEMEQHKARTARKDYWIKAGIVVKVMNKKLADGTYYKKKGVVLRVIDKFVAEVEMLRGGDVLRLDQSDLETVLPAKGGLVLIVNGLNRGEQATLQSIDVEKFCASIKLTTSAHRGDIMTGVEYEDICKLHAQP